VVDFFPLSLVSQNALKFVGTIGSAIHNVHNTIKGCNTGTSWISADRDSKLGKFCVCSTVCMHADGFANFNFRAIFIFREICEN